MRSVEALEFAIALVERENRNLYQPSEWHNDAINTLIELRDLILENESKF